MPPTVENLGAHNLEDILYTLPPSAFQSLEYDYGLTINPDFWKGLLENGDNPEAQFQIYALDYDHGFFAFTDKGEESGTRFELKVFVANATEFALCLERTWNQLETEASWTFFKRTSPSEWTDITEKAISKPSLKGFYPEFNPGVDAVALECRAHPELPEFYFRIAPNGAGAFYETMLPLKGCPEVKMVWEPKSESFKSASPEFSQIEQYFLAVPDFVVSPLMNYIRWGNQMPQVDPIFRWEILKYKHAGLYTNVLDPQNGYLKVAPKSDGGGDELQMVYWKLGNGSHLVGAVRISWGMCCQSGQLSLFLPDPVGWKDVSTQSAPDLRLGEVPWLKGRAGLSEEDGELQAFDIELPRQGKDIRLTLDRGTCEDGLTEAGFAAIDHPENFTAKTLKWMDGKFVW